MIPVELQRQVEEQKKQLEDVRRSLHNSYVLLLPVQHFSAPCGLCLR
jgi:hypothetical protein